MSRGARIAVRRCWRVLNLPLPLAFGGLGILYLHFDTVCLSCTRPSPCCVSLVSSVRLAWPYYLRCLTSRGPRAPQPPKTTRLATPATSNGHEREHHPVLPLLGGPLPELHPGAGTHSQYIAGSGCGFFVRPCSFRNLLPDDTCRSKILNTDLPGMHYNKHPAGALLKARF